MSFHAMAIEAAERGWVPDLVLRAAIRRLCRRRLEEERLDATAVASLRRDAFRRSWYEGPIAPLPKKANEQHYELPPEFFAAVLGPRRKYSCCLFADPKTTLAEAEEAALAAVCERAELADGQSILELGCGWGSFTLWAAEWYRNSRITAVSNSHAQRRYIEAAAAQRGFAHVRVITADMNDFEISERFDRIVSIEMFEHMRNYERLLERIARLLNDDGRLFIHIFCHQQLSYPFETEGADDWMGRHFFSGGMMPSADLLDRFDRHLKIVRRYRWNGEHYRRTAEAWLANLDARRGEVLPLLAYDHDEAEAARRLQRWRMFFLAVAELFGYAGGEEWFVMHYVLQRTG